MKKLALILMLFLLPTTVFAWGLLPAQQFADLTTKPQSLQLSIVNDEGAQGYFMVKFEGDLKAYASYAGGIININESTKKVTIPFRLSLPAELEPGTKTLEIKLEQVPDQQSSSTLRSLISLTGEVIIQVPYQGEFINAELQTKQGEVDHPLPITISILNKGENDTIVWADLTVKGPTNMPLKSWSTDKQVIAYQGSGKIVTAWTGEEPGIYILDVIVHHSEKTLELTKKIVVGEQRVNAESITSSRFTLGQINQLDISVSNTWNEEVKDVYAEIFVLTKEGQKIQQFITASKDIPAYSHESLVGYWDTKDILVGNYDLIVVTHTGDEQVQKTFPVTVQLGSLQTSVATGQVTKQASSNNAPLLIMLIVILIITNVIIIFYFRKMKRSH